MRSFNLPSSLSPQVPLPPENPLRPAPDAKQPAAPPSAAAPQDHPPSAAPNTPKALTAGKKAVALLIRLRASFARSEAVHQARLDAGWTGPERYLLAHYTCSAK